LGVDFMMGKTHAVLGSAAALAVTKPQSLGELAAVTAVSVIGSLLVDLDVKSSKANKMLNRIVVFTIAAGVITLAADSILKLGINRIVLEHTSSAAVFMKPLAVALFLIYAFLLSISGHRGFTHSIAATLMITAFAYCIFSPIVALALVTGYVVHIFFDIFNKKGEQLFYPLKKRFCLNLCKSDGIFSKTLFLLGMLLSGLELAGWIVILCIKK
jgi:membrane-bound metal-dependent hydrolase YbcI (DUF457 family)